MELYFAYGSNMSTARLQARVAGARPLGRAFVDDWRLVFDKPGRDGTGKANLASLAGARTWGVLFEIPAPAWTVLDGFEPGYERCAFRFERRETRAREAHAYVYPPASRVSEARAATNPPSEEYLEHVLAGAREHGLPRAHVAWISSFRHR